MFVGKPFYLKSVRPVMSVVLTKLTELKKRSDKTTAIEVSMALINRSRGVCDKTNLLTILYGTLRDFESTHE